MENRQKSDGVGTSAPKKEVRAKKGTKLPELTFADVVKTLDDLSHRDIKSGNTAILANIGSNILSTLLGL